MQGTFILILKSEIVFFYSIVKFTLKKKDSKVAGLIYQCLINDTTERKISKDFAAICGCR